MLLKSFSCLSLLAVSATCAALPDLPEPVTNNAVASTTVRGKTYLVSMLGMAAGKQASDIHNKVWMHTLGDFGWTTVTPVPMQQRSKGRLAASAVALNNNFFLFGGYSLNNDGSRQTVPESYRFDPVNQRYTRLNDIPVPVDNAAALAYQNRYIYLINGWSNDGAVNLVQVFDNYTQRWSQATPFPGKAVFGLSGGIIGNTMLLCDGVTVQYHADKPREFVSSPACYQGNISTNANTIDWKPVPHPTGSARYRMGAIGTKLNGEDIIVFIGGSDTPYDYNTISYQQDTIKPDAKVWVYSVAQQKWLAAADTTPVMDLRGLLEINGEIYSVGGMQTGQQVTNKLIKHPIKLL
ncbi:galactose oxidase [Chromatiaceae bacterium AAb-1]|nr:galactose oxidase [Chromatiaceae bacterium AAb-1]